jgi:hypothetical protein
MKCKDDFYYFIFSGAASLWGAGAEQYRTTAAASAGVHCSGLFFSRRTQALLARLPQSRLWQSQIPGTKALLQSTHAGHRPNNYKGTKLYMSSLLVFNKVHRLNIQSGHVGIFDLSCKLAPLYLLSSSPPAPLPV